MNRISRCLFVALVFAFGLAAPAGAQSSQSTVSGGAYPFTAAEIVDRAVTRSEAQMESGVEADFESMVDYVIDSLNGSGEVTGSETSRARRFAILGAMFDEMFEIDGRPLTDKERREEAERREEFEEEVRDRLARGLPPQPEDERQVKFNRYLMDRYDTAIIGEEDVRGHRCWVVSMRPREGDLPERTRMDKALNQANGRLWIAQDDFGVARVEFILDRPINYLGGFLAKVRKTDGRIEIDRVAPGIWLPIEFELQLDLRVFFKSIRRVITSQWTEYERAAGTPVSF